MANKTLFPCLLLLLFLSLSASGVQSSAECMNALYRGAVATKNLYTEIERVGRERRRELRDVSVHPLALTCGKAEMMFSTLLSQFNEKGCSWGTTDNRVFESKVLTILEMVTKGCPCPMFEGVCCCFFLIFWSNLMTFFQPSSDR